MLKKIATDKAPGAIGPYSQAIVCGQMVYTSGQIPLDPRNGQMVEGDIKVQTSAPARSCVAVKDLPKGALVEVEVIACLDA